MPHQCVKCEKIYEDGSKELLSGCHCGSKFFFFMKTIPKPEEFEIKLTPDEKKQIEQDVIKILGDEYDERPIILDIESIRIAKPGKYELDLIDLFKGRPVVYKTADGKYFIDLASTFEAKKKNVI